MLALFEPDIVWNAPDTVRHGDLLGTAANGDFDVPFVHVWTVQDGKATSFTEYFDTVRMNRAIG